MFASRRTSRSQRRYQNEYTGWWASLLPLTAVFQTGLFVWTSDWLAPSENESPCGGKGIKMASQSIPIKPCIWYNSWTSPFPQNFWQGRLGHLGFHHQTYQHIHISIYQLPGSVREHRVPIVTRALEDHFYSGQYQLASHHVSKSSSMLVGRYPHARGVDRR